MRSSCTQAHITVQLITTFMTTMSPQVGNNYWKLEKTDNESQQSKTQL